MATNINNDKITHAQYDDSVVLTFGVDFRVGVAPFCNRHTEESPYSHTDAPLEKVANLLYSSPKDVWLREGYKPREGRTLLLRVPKWFLEEHNFYSGIAIIKPGEEVISGFRSRVEGELPRPFREVVRSSKPKAATVDLVFYNTTALMMTGDNGIVTDTPDNSWELVTILASEDDNLESPPPTPIAVLSNYLGSDGGTPTSETRLEFLNHLNKSIDYWSIRANVVVKSL